MTKNNLSGAKFELKNNEEILITKKLDTNGTLSINDIPDGTYNYTLSKTGYKTTEGQITLNNGTILNLKLYLEEKTKKRKKEKKVKE